MNRPDIGQDPRFATIAQRVAHRDVLVPMLEAITSTRTIDEWVAAMEAVDVPCGPINTIDRVFADAQVRARGIALELPHLQCASVPSVASPMRFSQTPLRYTQAPPVLGQHTREVLGRLLGLEASQLQALVTKGTIKATP
jgi:crotonobetainyl-CoA:carnitine CoA-transferase CaiB-like acyl-CoA transferase